MIDPLQNVTPGGDVEYSAARENLINKAARAALYGEPGGVGFSPVANPSARTVLVKNDVGKALPVGDVVRMSSAILAPTTKRPFPQMVFTAALPDVDELSSAVHKLAVLAEPLAEGDALVKAYVAGVFPARFKLTGSSSHDMFADIDIDDPTSTTLVQTLSGGAFGVLWFGPPDPDAGEGVCWAIVTPIQRRRRGRKYDVEYRNDDSQALIWGPVKGQY